MKTTTFAKETPFYASSSEIRFAQSYAERFSLYLLFEFRRAPKCFELPGSIDAHCALDPSAIVAHFGSHAAGALNCAGTPPSP